MLGTVSEAQDAVQEAWLRLGRSDPGGIGDLRGWLTTVVGRISLDMLRARKAPPRELPRQLAARTAGGRFRRRRPRTPGGAGRHGRPGPACGAAHPQPRRTALVLPARCVP